MFGALATLSLAAAGLSPEDFVVAFCAALAGAAAYEPIKERCAGLRARKPPLAQWFWQITYPPHHRDWSRIWSIELVRVRRRGDRVWGTMYRIYPSHHRRRWEFEGQIHEERHLSFVYRSIGKDYGSSGTLNLGLLRRGLWCGAFEQIPEVERGVDPMRAGRERRQTRRIGPDFTEEALIEWLSAEESADDPVRGFLASIPASSAISPQRAEKHLPASARRVLTESPPFRGWLLTGLQAAGAAPSPELILAGERARRELRPVARRWVSPARSALGLQRNEAA